MEASTTTKSPVKKSSKRPPKGSARKDKAFGRLSLLDLDEITLLRWRFLQLRGDLRNLQHFQQGDPSQSASPSEAPGELRNAIVNMTASSSSSAGGVTSGSSVGLRCHTCEIPCFASLSEQHEHFKSSWHVTNLKRKAKGSRVFSRQESDEYHREKENHKLHRRQQLESPGGGATATATATAGAGAGAGASAAVNGDGFCSSSSSSLSSCSSESENASVSASVGGEPVIEFMDGTSVFKIYKDLMPRLDQEDFNPYKSLDSLRNSKFKWAVFLLRSGRFAGAIFHKDKAICHKTFQRYTTRRKQGGNQSKHDKTNGKARSAGAQIRRYNEVALKQDIAELLHAWKSLLQDVEMIFLASGESDRSSFFGDKKEVVLQPTDPRLRRIPFVTARPTFEEVCRVRSELCSIRFAPIEAEEVVVTRRKSPTKATSTHVKLQDKVVNTPRDAAPQEQQSHEAEQVVVPALIEAVRCNDLARVKALVTSGAVETIDVVDQEFMTALHHAAQQNATSMIQFLLEHDANPSLLDLRRRPAFFLCETKESRNVFRRFRGEFPTKWDYTLSQIAEPITQDSEAKRKQKEQEKRKRQKQKKKLLKQQLQQEEQARLVRLAHEEQARLLQEACDCCGEPAGKSPFSRLEFKYCSTDCVAKHRRQLMSEAALKRMGA